MQGSKVTITSFFDSLFCIIVYIYYICLIRVESVNPNRSITIFIILFFLVCSISAFFTYFELQSKLTKIENQIELHNDGFVQLQSDLIQIQGSLGFGG